MTNLITSLAQKAWFLASAPKETSDPHAALREQISKIPLPHFHDSEMCIRIGSEIYRWRIDNDVARDELAQRAKIVTKALETQERGRHCLSLDDLSKVSEAMGTNIVALLVSAATRMPTMDKIEAYAEKALGNYEKRMGEAKDCSSDSNTRPALAK